MGESAAINASRTPSSKLPRALDFDSIEPVNLFDEPHSGSSPPVPAFDSNVPVNQVDDSQPDSSAPALALDSVEPINLEDGSHHISFSSVPQLKKVKIEKV